MRSKLFFFAVVFLFGCAKPGASPPSVTTGSQPLQGISGQWGTPCLKASNQSSSGVVSFDENGVTLEGIVFRDANCATPSSRVTYKASISIGESLLAVGATAIDFLARSYSLTAVDETEAARFASEKRCGITTWVPGVPVDISDKTCLGSNLPGQLHRDIVKVSGASLQFGEVVANDARPSALAPLKYGKLTPRL